MDGSLWKTPQGSWAVCAGAGPTGVKGYIIEQPKGGWTIEGHQPGVVFADAESAASNVLGFEVTGTLDYTISKDGETRIVRAGPGLIEALKREGWTVLEKGSPLERRKS